MPLARKHVEILRRYALSFYDNTDKATVGFCLLPITRSLKTLFLVAIYALMLEDSVSY